MGVSGSGDRLARGAVSATFLVSDPKSKERGEVFVGSEKKNFPCECGAVLADAKEFSDHVHYDCPSGLVPWGNVRPVEDLSTAGVTAA